MSISWRATWRVSHQVRYGLGAYLPLPSGFGLAGEVEGGTSFFNAETLYTPLEAYLGVRWVHKQWHQREPGRWSGP